MATSYILKNNLVITSNGTTYPKGTVTIMDDTYQGALNRRLRVYPSEYDIVLPEEEIDALFFKVTTDGPVQFSMGCTWHYKHSNDDIAIMGLFTYKDQVGFSVKRRVVCDNADPYVFHTYEQLEELWKLSKCDIQYITVIVDAVKEPICEAILAPESIDRSKSEDYPIDKMGTPISLSDLCVIVDPLSSKLDYQVGTLVIADLYDFRTGQIRINPYGSCAHVWAYPSSLLQVNERFDFNIYRVPGVQWYTGHELVGIPREDILPEELERMFQHFVRSNPEARVVVPQYLYV